MDKDYKYFLDEGIYETENKQYDCAIENLDKSIELKNDFDISYFYRAVCYQALEKWDEAMLDYTKAIQLNDKMTDAYYNRANIILSRKDIENPKIENAIKDLEKALELDPNFNNALFALAAAKHKLKEHKEALIYLDRVIENCPDHIYAKALKKLILKKYTP